MRDVTLIMTASIDCFVDAPAGHAGGLAWGGPDALHLQLAASTTYASGATRRIFEPRGWGSELEETEQ